MTPKSERILGSRRYETHCKERRKGVEAVGKGKDLSGKARRDGILGEAGQVMLGDRVSHRLGLAVVQGVLPSHDPLQRRELPDHAGHEIGLAEYGGPPTVLDRVEVAERIGQLSGHGRDAPHFLVKGAKLLVESHSLEFFDSTL